MVFSPKYLNLYIVASQSQGNFFQDKSVDHYETGYLSFSVQQTMVGHQPTIMNNVISNLYKREGAAKV